MADMAKTSGKKAVTNEKIMGFLVEMDEKVSDMQEKMVTKADLADTLKDYATRNDLERVKDEILDAMEPIIKAVDRDAETVINHGKRITVLERRAGVAAK